MTKALFQEPKVELVRINLDLLTTVDQSCSNSEYESSTDICSCTNSAKSQLVGGDCSSSLI